MLDSLKKNQKKKDVHLSLDLQLHNNEFRLLHCHFNYHSNIMRCLIKGVIKTHLMSIFTKRSMLNGDPIICQRIQVEFFIQLALRCMKLCFFLLSMNFEFKTWPEMHSSYNMACFQVESQRI
jgi:hypothetical protein